VIRDRVHAFQTADFWRSGFRKYAVVIEIKEQDVDGAAGDEDIVEAKIAVVAAPTFAAARRFLHMDQCGC
jgi:hypothetical protein